MRLKGRPLRTLESQSQLIHAFVQQFKKRKKKKKNQLSCLILCRFWYSVRLTNIARRDKKEEKQEQEAAPCLILCSAFVEGNGPRAAAACLPSPFPARAEYDQTHFAVKGRICQENVNGFTVVKKSTRDPPAEVLEKQWSRI